MRDAPPRGRPAPRPLNDAALENAALFYLERYATSSANLKRVLLRRVARAAVAEPDLDVADWTARIDALIARYLAAGLLDDRAYAAQKAASLRRRGVSRRALQGHLAQRGLAREVIAGTIAALEAAGSDDFAAACMLVRRRRLGPCRAEPARSNAHRRDLAALARAGFSLDLARRVLAVPDQATLERLMRQDSEAE